MSARHRNLHRALIVSALAIAALLAGCAGPSTPPTQAISPAPSAQQAQAANAYRPIAARHLYERNAPRIHQGQLPPVLYAVGVLEVDIDTAGQPTRLHWKRAPAHAPEVVAEIERTVRAAAPFPAPGHSVTYTDVWLWTASGQFQLDALTEGQP